MRDPNPITGIISIVRNESIRQTREALVLFAQMPKTPETRELLNRLKIADQKIKKQLDFVEKLDRLVKKYV